MKSFLATQLAAPYQESGSVAAAVKLNPCAYWYWQNNDYLLTMHIHIDNDSSDLPPVPSLDHGQWSGLQLEWSSGTALIGVNRIEFQHANDKIDSDVDQKRPRVTYYITHFVLWSGQAWQRHHFKTKLGATCYANSTSTCCGTSSFR